MQFTAEKIEQWWKAGKTLPIEVAKQYPLDPITVSNDTGINLLVDMSHKCDSFCFGNWVSSCIDAEFGVQAVMPPSIPS